MFRNSSGKIELPSAPAILTRIIQITRSEEASSDEIAHVVLMDQALSAKVMRLANSAYYGRRKRVENVSEAVLTLGCGYVRNLAASASVLEAIFPRRVFVGFSWDNMWKHSVICAVAAESLQSFATGNHKKGDETSFIAGLIHDIGKMIIAYALPGKFVQIIEKCREQNIDMYTAEKSIIGTDHALIGKELAAQWELPEVLQMAIGFHHNPQAAKSYQDKAQLIKAANLLAKRLGRSYIFGLHSNIKLNDIAKLAGVDPANMDFVVNDINIGIKRCGEIISWGDNMPDDINLKVA